MKNLFKQFNQLQPGTKHLAGSSFLVVIYAFVCLIANCAAN
jgi:hypothetical protein